MIQLVPQLRIRLACQPVDFRRGLDSLLALCRNDFREDTTSGTLYVFRNRQGTALKLVVYDGHGYWLCYRRFAEGRLRWWPRAADTPLHPLEAQHLAVLLYNGLPEQARFAAPWRRLPAQTPQLDDAAAAGAPRP